MGRRLSKKQRNAQQRRSRRAKLIAAGAQGAVLEAGLDDPTVDADQALAEMRWWPKAIVDQAILDEHLHGKEVQEECLGLGCDAPAVRGRFFCLDHLPMVPAELRNQMSIATIAQHRARFTAAADAAILAVKSAEDPRGMKALRKGQAA